MQFAVALVLSACSALRERAKMLTNQAGGRLQRVKHMPNFKLLSLILLLIILCILLTFTIEDFGFYA